MTGNEITGGASAFSGHAADVGDAVNQLVGAAERGNLRPTSAGSAAGNVAGVPVADVSQVEVRRAPVAAVPGFRKGQFRKIDVILTYDGMDLPPIIFPCRMRMSDEAQKAHEDFQGLPTSDRAAKRFCHHLRTLADVIIGEPVGVDDFPPPNVAPAEPGTPGFDEYRKDLQSRFLSYFNDPDEDMIAAILQAAFNRYFIKIVPKEYL